MANFETVLLTLEKAEAARLISDRVSHVRRTESGGAVEFRTNLGVHLATLSDADLPGGERGSKLRYRTSVVLPHLVHAHNKAREIRQAVERYRLEPSRGW